jgi:LacI family transcriptional regulator
MSKFHILSAVEQVAGHLKHGIVHDVWRGEMPGVISLAAELGVNHKTVEAALSQLEREGLLRGQGARRPRAITNVAKATARSLRVGILLYEPADCRLDYIVDIRHELSEAGHVPVFAKKAISEIGNDIGRLAKLVRDTEVEAWVVMAGTREVLEWFHARPQPVFALFGRFIGLKMAGTGCNKAELFSATVRQFAALGHRRIVLLARPGRKLPEPGFSEQAFLSALQAEGIAVGDYHFPLWEENKDGFLRCLDSLFGKTPPTALLVEEPTLFAAVQQFLATRRLRVPEDVSLVCTGQDLNFIWQEPSVTHFSADSAPWVSHLLRWASHASQGKPYHRQIFSQARFIKGATMGPAAQ